MRLPHVLVPSEFACADERIEMGDEHEVDVASKRFHTCQQRRKGGMVRGILVLVLLSIADPTLGQAVAQDEGAPFFGPLGE
jgi:hypothetical protein